MFDQIVAIGEKTIADFKDGKWASVAHDVGDGFHKIGDVLSGLFGFQGSQSEKGACDKVESTIEALKACSVGDKVAAVDGIDPLKVIAMIQQLASAIEAAWKIWKS